MSKSKAKPATAAPPARKGGDGGRITKPAAKVEKAKTVAKAVVAAAAAAGPVKPSKVFLLLVAPNSSDCDRRKKEGRRSQ